MLKVLEELLNGDRRLRLQYKMLPKSKYYSPDLAQIVDNYVDFFITKHGLSIKFVVESYNKFLANYLNDVTVFKKTGKYPVELDQIGSLDRYYYDIALLLSVSLTEPRHRIMKNIFEFAPSMLGDTLVIGVGSGLELELIEQSGNYQSLDAYDIEISEHIKQKFALFNLYEAEYKHGNALYNNIFAIELLEHLADPISFCRMIHRSLLIGGNFIATTATNIPQHDHLVNFIDNIGFEKEIESIGFEIVRQEVIKHESSFLNIDSSNTFYIFKKI